MTEEKKEKYIEMIEDKFLTPAVIALIILKYPNYFSQCKYFYMPDMLKMLATTPKEDRYGGTNNE